MFYIFAMNRHVFVIFWFFFCLFFFFSHIMAIR